MKTLAAVLVETGRPLELAELQVPAPGPGQVLVEVAFSGVCHTQVLECRGHRGPDPYLPHCLGHEGSGIVLEPGPGVTKVAEGDRVVLSWIKGAGLDAPGPKYGWDGRTVNAGAIATFGRHAIVAENRLSPIPEGVPLREAALIGCCAATGLGSVFNTARLRPGQSAVVFGCGGIGLCAVAGARLAGAARVVAVDVVPARLDAARAMGADFCIRADESDPVAAIAELLPGGADVAIEATGRPPVMAQALKSVRPRGGITVVVGNARAGQLLELDPGELNQGKHLLGTWGGDNWPDNDFQRYFSLLSAGRLDLKPILGGSYRLDQINQAIDDLEAGHAVRPLVELSLPWPPN